MGGWRMLPFPVALSKSLQRPGPGLRPAAKNVIQVAGADGRKPRSTWAGSRSQESEPEIKPRHSGVGQLIPSVQRLLYIMDF